MGASTDKSIEACSSGFSFVGFIDDAPAFYIERSGKVPSTFMQASRKEYVAGVKPPPSIMAWLRQ